MIPRSNVNKSIFGFKETARSKQASSFVVSAAVPFRWLA
jgi:hypothetical protein